MCATLAATMIFARQYPGISPISSIDIRELLLLERTLELAGHEVMVSSSLVLRLSITGTKQDLETVVRQLQVEFGTRVIREKGVVRLRNDAVKYRRVLRSPTSFSKYSQTLASASALAAVCRNILKLQPETKLMNVVSVEYSIRPWLDEKLKRTDEVFGELVLRDGKVNRTIPFAPS